MLETIGTLYVDPVDVLLTCGFLQVACRRILPMTSSAGGLRHPGLLYCRKPPHTGVQRFSWTPTCDDTPAYITRKTYMAKLSWLLSRPIITPITAAFFLLVSLTGILLLLHVPSRAVKETHELIGVLFVIGAAVHLVLNWRCFTSYLKSRVTVVAGAVIGILFAFLLVGTRDRNEAAPATYVFRLFETAPLAHVAPLLGIEAEQAAATLRQRGLGVTGEEQTIGDIAKSNGRHVLEILGVFHAAGTKADR